jgi:hypothetical protein
MRFYSFTNANYMSQLQLGLQTAHCVAELAIKYTGCPGIWDFEKWAQEHKTIVILNGGNCADLSDLREFLTEVDNQHPFAVFHEDEASLNNAITCVGIILPEEVYETARLIRNRTFYCLPDTTRYVFSGTYDSLEHARLSELCKFYNDADEWTVDLINRLNRCGLA